ncbi:MAG: hypothetical protein R3D85_03900 [Paracoccaceae bacterium]
MPCSYSYFADVPLIAIRYSGRITSRALLNIARELRTAPEFDPRFDLLIDMRALIDVDFSANDLLGHAMRLAMEKKGLARPVRYAVLIDEGNEEVRALVRTYLGYTALAENVEFREFGDAVAAASYLGVQGTAEDILARASWVEVDDGSG